MGKQHNKVEKRRRQIRYLKRKRDEAAAAPKKASGKS